MHDFFDMMVAIISLVYKLQRDVIHLEMTEYQKIGMDMENNNKKISF